METDKTNTCWYCKQLGPFVVDNQSAAIGINSDQRFVMHIGALVITKLVAVLVAYLGAMRGYLQRNNIARSRRAG